METKIRDWNHDGIVRNLTDAQQVAHAYLNPPAGQPMTQRRARHIVWYCLSTNPSPEIREYTKQFATELQS